MQSLIVSEMKYLGDTLNFSGLLKQYSSRKLRLGALQIVQIITFIFIVGPAKTPNKSGEKLQIVKVSTVISFFFFL